MATDWELIRRMMAAVIDACAAMEAAGLDEKHRALPLSGTPATIFDALVSGWTYPESLRARIIHARHAAGADQPYVPEAARMLIAMAGAAGELVGGREAAPAEAEIAAMIAWYARISAQVTAAIADAGEAPGDAGTP